MRSGRYGLIGIILSRWLRGGFVLRSHSRYGLRHGRRLNGFMYSDVNQSTSQRDNHASQERRENFDQSRRLGHTIPPEVERAMRHKRFGRDG